MDRKASVTYDFINFSMITFVLIYKLNVVCDENVSYFLELIQVMALFSVEQVELRDVDTGNKITERFRTDEALESM